MVRYLKRGGFEFRVCFSRVRPPALKPCLRPVVPASPIPYFSPRSLAAVAPQPPRTSRLIPMSSPTSLFQPLRTTLFSARSGPRIHLRRLRRISVFTRVPWQFPSNPFLCHTSKICAPNSFPCHTSKNTRLKVLCLPHIQKLAGVGVLLLTRTATPKNDAKEEAMKGKSLKTWHYGAFGQTPPAMRADRESTARPLRIRMSSLLACIGLDLLQNFQNLVGLSDVDQGNISCQ
jgi:hypothetical protein